MAALNFPLSPINGQQYPDPAIPGVNVYNYTSTYNTWTLLGRASSVVPGTYGDNVTCVEVTVDVTGVIQNIVNKPIPSVTNTQKGLLIPGIGLTVVTTGTVDLAPPLLGQIGGVKAGTNISIATDGTISVPNSSVTNRGAVQLNNTLTSTSITEALTAAQGNVLYQYIQEIGYGQGVTFLPIDDISAEFDGIETTFTLTENGSPLTNAVPGDNLVIEIGGILQTLGQNYDYFPNAAQIVFTSAPEPSYGFSGRYFDNVGTAINYVYTLDNLSPLFDGFTTQFVLAVGGVTIPPGIPVGDIIIEVGGVNQIPDVNFSYNPTTSTVTFSTAPGAGVGFGGRYFIASPYTDPGVPVLNPLDDIQPLFDGIETSFHLDYSGGSLPPVTGSDQLLIFLGGVLQVPNINYSLDAGSSVIIFFTPPQSTFTFDGRAALTFGGASKGTVTRVNTGAGLTGGPITGVGTISLGVSGVTAGSYTNPSITVDTYGRITSASASPVSVPYFIRNLDSVSSLFNGSTVTFTLAIGGVPYTPTPTSNLMVFIGGVVQIPTVSYTVSGNQITFTEAPASGVTFYATTVSTSTGSTTYHISSIDTIAPLFDGVTTAFDIKIGNVSYTPSPASNLMVFVGGIAQVPTTAYSVIGSQIIFTEAPLANADFYATSITNL
jgi:hypothetical protein